jgi:outer membrane immunogenic protein
MKKLILALSILATSAVSASAAGTAQAAVAPPPVALYSWTGFYVGGNIGYNWGRSSDNSTLTNTAGTVLFASSGTSNLDGVIGGGQIGYNWQMQNWVWGLEADIQGSEEKGGREYTCPTGVCTPTTTVFVGFRTPLLVIPGAAVPGNLTDKIDWFGTVRGRVGFLAGAKVLLYATGGLAYGGVNSSEIIGAPAFGFSTSDTRAGWTVGAGVEGVIGGNWTAKLEYLYIDLGTTSGSFLTPIAAFGGGFVSANYSSHITDNILRVGVNYRFNGPAVAKY